MLRPALLALALVLAFAAPAAAQEVTAREEGGKLAVTLTVPGAEPITETGPLPVWPDDAVMATVFKDGQVYVGGVVAAGAASVEIGFERDQLIRVPVASGGFFTGQVTSIDTDDNPNSIRIFDAGGALIGVADSPETTRGAEILRRGGVTFRAKVTSRLAPVALAPDHRSEDLCLFAQVRRGDGGELACRGRPSVVSLVGHVGCGRTPTILTGFLPDGSSRLDLLLGSGRTLRVTPRTAPLEQPGLMVLATLPRGEAVRRATVRDGSGRVLDRVSVRVAPPFRRCGASLERWSAVGVRPSRLGRPPGTQLAAALASDGGPQLLARDDGDRLCVGLDGLDGNGGDCFLPAFSGRNNDAFRIEQGAAVGVVPAQVAEVELYFAGGGHIIAPALPGIDYSGRYHDVVHFVLAPLPIGKTVADGRALDAAGREIGFVYLQSPARVLGRPKPVLREGSDRVVANGFVNRTVAPCIGLAGQDCDAFYDFDSAGSVRVVAPCDRRRTILFGFAPSGYRRIDVRVAHGQPVRAQLAPLPRGLGGAGKVYLAVLGPDAEVTGVHFSGQLPHTFTVPARAARAQCGWQWEDYAL